MELGYAVRVRIKNISNSRLAKHYMISVHVQYAGSE